MKLFQPNQIQTLLEERERATPLTVLVVDDSRVQRKIVSTHLKKWGFQVLEAEDGERALSICKTQSIDLILSDWVMPGMDGLEFCRAFREMSGEKYVYFILLTSKNEKNDVSQAFEDGADDFLAKPFSSTELKARVRAGERVVDMQLKLEERRKSAETAYGKLKQVHAELNKDLAEAGKLQQSLVPARHQQFEFGEVSILFKSSHHVGGDYVGFFSFNETQLAIYSLDVSGHGVSSALLTARLAGYLSPHSRAQNVAFYQDKAGQYHMREPREIARILNDRMIQEMDTELYFTMVFADIDLRSGHVTMCQAGHPHPVIFNPESGVRFVGQGGPPIGLMPDMVYENTEIQLMPGDRILLYSDGLSECQNLESEMLEEDGLADIITRHIHGSGPEFIDDLMWEVATFAKGRPFDDDVSGLLFELKQSVE